MSVVRNRLLCLLFNLLITISATSQILHRTVLSFESREPLEGVNVTVLGTEAGTSTDKQGRFFLSKIPGLRDSDILRFSYVGYQSKKVSFKEILNNESRIFLSESTENLKEVVLSAEKAGLKRTITFDKMSPLIKPLCCFVAVPYLDGEKIVLIGGDESCGEDNPKRRLSEAPTLSMPGSSLIDMANRATSNLEWRHFSGAVYTYDIANDKWETMGTDVMERAYHSAVLHNDSIFVMGGKRLANSSKSEFLVDGVEVLDIEGFKLVVDRINPHRAVNFGSVVHSDNLFVFGGSTKIGLNDQREFSEKVHMYNFSSGYWYELKSLAKGKETSGTLIGETYYMIGGLNRRPLREIEVYDLNTGESFKEAELFEGMERPGIASKEGIIYVLDNGKLLTYDTELRILKEFLIDMPVRNPFLVI